MDIAHCYYAYRWITTNTRAARSRQVRFFQAVVRHVYKRFSVWLADWGQGGHGNLDLDFRGLGAWSMNATVGWRVFV